jgi:outer membrane protein TolC
MNERRGNPARLLAALLGAAWVGTVPAQTGATAQAAAAAGTATAAAVTNAPPAWSLDECLRYAAKRSRELRALELGFESQKLATLIRQGDFQWRLSADVEHRMGDEDANSGSLSLRRSAASGVDVTASVQASDGEGADDDTASWSLRLSKVVLGGADESRLPLDLAALDELIRRNAVVRYRRELVLKVKRAFYRVIQAFQTERIAEMRLERARTTLEHAAQRDNLLDLAAAKLEAPDAESARLQAQRATESALDELKTVIGMDVATPLNVRRELDFRPREVNPAADLRHCLANHEDLLNKRLEFRKLEMDETVRRAKTLPQVKLRGGVSQGSEEAMDFGADPEFTAGLSLAWTWISRPERAALRKALKDLEAKRLEIEILAQEKERGLRDLVRRLDETLQLIAIQEERVKLAEWSLALYRDRWENGEIGILEYLRSQNNLENSRIQLLNLRTTYMDRLSEYLFTAGK